MTDQPRRKYTAEFKREAVELVTKQGYTTAEAARCFLQVGIPHFCKTFSPAPVGKIKLT